MVVEYVVTFFFLFHAHTPRQTHSLFIPTNT